MRSRSRASRRSIPTCSSRTPDGRNARPFLPDRALDYNASFSPDGKWIVFTSTRGGIGRRLSRAPRRHRSSRSSRTAPRSTIKACCRRTGACSRSSRAAAVRRTSGRSISSPATCATSRARRAETSGRSGRPTASGSRSRPIARPTNPKFTFATLHSTELYVVRADGTELRRVTQAARVRRQPAVVGGRQVAALSTRRTSTKCRRSAAR